MRNNYFKAAISLVMLTLFSFTGLIAQNISGVVNDENGEPLPGASVLVVGTTNGTTTDFDGNYSIDVNQDEEFTLSASFMGYQNAEKKFSPGSDQNWSPQLQPDAGLLEDVVVIGYGSVRKEDATGSVSAISSKDFNTGAITAPQDLLTGKTPGVQITTDGGAPGAKSTIRIRGGASMSASNDPLIIIDGVPMDNEEVSGMRNPLNAINPNDIETFTVLKDASATAIYGSRASNGVIIVTTKKGSSSSKLKVNYSGNVSVSMLPKHTKVYSGDEFRAIIKSQYGDPSDAVSALGTANTDWQEEVFQLGVGTDHNVNLSGGLEALPYRLSVGYTDQKGTLKTSKLQRTTLGLNLNPTFFDGALKVDASIKGVFVKNRFANTGAIGSAIGYDPTQSVMDDNPDYVKYGGYHTWVGADGNYLMSVAPSNPVAMLDLENNSSNVSRIITNLQVNYDLAAVEGLSVNLNLGMDASTSTGTVNVDPMSAWNYNNLDQTKNGHYSEYSQEKMNQVLDFYTKYVTDIESIDSRIDAMVGYSWQHFSAEKRSQDWSADKSFEKKALEINPSENYLVSFFGRFNYSLKDRYLFTASVRQDGTSRFSKDTRTGIFPSYAFAWKVKEESFLKEVKAVSSLKLRIGYGVTGQQQIGGDFPYLATYQESVGDLAYYPVGIDGNGNPIYETTLRPNGYDADIKWETTTTFNIGLDFGFVDDRISGTIDAYSRVTDDLINYIPVAAGANLTNFITTNVGSMTNKGVELGLVVRPVVTQDFYWEIGANLTYNKNEITKLTAVDDPNYKGVLTGDISGGTGQTIQIHSVGYSTNTFYVYEQVYDDTGNPIEGVYVDQNGDNIINDEDKVHYGNSAPDMMFGINSRLEYKKFTFSFSGRAQFGNSVYNNNSSDKGIHYEMYTANGVLNNRISEGVHFNSYQYQSSHYVQDGSFFRMDNISLGYDFGGVVGEGTGLNVSASVQNAFVITGYEGLDPEVFSGIDNNAYPRPTTFTLGLNLNF